MKLIHFSGCMGKVTASHLETWLIDSGSGEVGSYVFIRKLYWINRCIVLLLLTNFYN
jgi:hypothetical protein